MQFNNWKLFEKGTIEGNSPVQLLNMISFTLYI